MQISFLWKQSCRTVEVKSHFSYKMNIFPSGSIINNQQSHVACNTLFLTLNPMSFILQALVLSGCFDAKNLI